VISHLGKGPQCLIWTEIQDLKFLLVKLCPYIRGYRQKISIPTPSMVIENSKGVGVSIAKIFKEEYELQCKLQFLGGVGVQT